MPTTIKLNSPIFDNAKRQQALSNAISKAAREYAAYVPKQQIESHPSGRQYRRRGGAGYQRFHRASARGERPAPDSGNLSRRTKSKKTGELSADVTTVAKRDGFDYAAQLEDRMDRPIQNAPSDLKEAQRLLDKNAEVAIAKIT